MQVKSSQKKFGLSPVDSNKEKFSKHEISAFKTVAVMQAGFTVTLGKTL